MKLAVTDQRLPEAALDALLKMGFEVLLLPPCENLPTPLNSHTDMLLFRYEKRLITEGGYYERNKALLDRLRPIGIDITTCKANFSRSYPYDAILNALKVGDRLFIKSDTAAREILELAKEAELRICEVRQGYPACTVLPLSDSAAITADRGMARALAGAGVKVTLIDDSDRIKLPPYKNGFIGGCAGRYKDTVYFIGNLDAHPECEAIKEAVSAAGLSSVSLMPKSDFLFDLGGILFFDDGL